MKYLILILAILLVPYSANATLTVSGTISGGSQITITGTGFGATGPTINIFDDFESGSNGATISTSGAPVGTWTKTNGYDPYYDNLSWSAGSSPHGSFSMQTGAYQDAASTERVRGMRQDFGTNIEEIFLSYYFMIPDGSRFPGNPLTADETIPGSSIWKMTWLRELENDGGSNDVCILTKSSSSEWKIQGNSGLVDLNSPTIGSGDNPDLMTTAFPTPPEWFVFDNWSRMAVWLKADDTTTYGWTGITEAQMLSEGLGSVDYNYTNVRVLEDAYWRWLLVPGWMRSPSDTTDQLSVKPTYDDIYIAIGPNAAARVEIGNHATYTSATKLAIATVDTWSATSITTTVRAGVFAADDTVYVYVIDASNNVVDTSAAKTFDAGAPAPSGGSIVGISATGATFGIVPTGGSTVTIQ